MASENIVTLTESNFDPEVIESATPVVVDFWGESCPPCRMLAPILDELAVEYNGKLKVAKVNVEQHPPLAGQYGIRAIPTLLIFKQGQVVDQVIGLKSKKDYKLKFDRALTM